MNPLYACHGCESGQPVVTSAETVVRTRHGVWVAVVVCNDCGDRRFLPVSDGEAAEVIYWRTVGVVVAEAEQIVKEAARG